MRNDDKDKFYTSDYLLGKVDPYDLQFPYVRTVNSNRSYYDVIQRARVLDKKIKASKMPSYEDLKAFHEISKEMEEKL